LQITGPLDVLSPQKDSSVIELAELGLIKTISLAETFLERGSTYTNDLAELTSLTTHFRDSIKLNGASMADLKKQLARLDSIDAIANFNPVVFKSRTTLSTATVVGTTYWGIIIIGIVLLGFLIRCLCPSRVAAACINLCGTCRKKRQAPVPTSEEEVSFTLRRRAFFRRARQPRELVVFHSNSNLSNASSRAQSPIFGPPRNRIRSVHSLLEEESAALRISPFNEDWQVACGDVSQLILYRYIPVRDEEGDKAVFVQYDFVEDVVLDKDGQFYPKVEKPSKNLIKAYNITVRTRPLPPMVMLGNTPYLKDHLHIFSGADGNWRDLNSGQVIVGLRKPTAEDFARSNLPDQL
jgi:hypothetical protein